MLTPVFELSEDDDFVLVLIRTPYVKISDVDFYINGTEFKFYVKPYFLRLNLPGELIEDGRESASYDVDKGTFSVKLPKLHAGESFEGLDLLTTLLAPKKKKPATTKPLIELAGGDEKFKEGDPENGSHDDEDDFDWEVKQNLPLSSQENSAIIVNDMKYGFANERTGIFNGREAELHEIAEVPDPESMTLSERQEARRAAEYLKFDEEYYLADFFNEDQIQHLLDYKPPWHEIFIQHKENVLKNKTEGSSGPDEAKVQFTDLEKDQLRRLPNKDYLLDDKEEIALFLGLIDIIYAYAYNHRTTEGESTVESQWTIARISSTLSWFESFSSIHDVLVSCSRRSLSYPLYRQWSLVEAVMADTKKIFALGRKQVLKCLLEIHALFREEDPWYLLNDLYVTDYCVWIQKASRKKLSSLAQSIEQAEIHKKDLSWQLDELELAAALVEREEQNVTSGSTLEPQRGSDGDDDDDDDDDCDDDCDDDGDGGGDDDDDDGDSDGDDDDDDNDADDESGEKDRGNKNESSGEIIGEADIKTDT